MKIAVTMAESQAYYEVHSEMEKQFFKVEGQFLGEMERDREYRHGEQSRQQNLFPSMRVEMNHTSRAQQAVAKATEATMPSLRQSLEATKKSET